MTSAVDILIRAQDKASGPINNVTGSLKTLQGTGSSALEQLQKPVSALTVAFGNLAGTMLTRGVDAIMNMGRSIVATGIGFNDMSQQAEIAFTTMLGSADKAKQYLSDLQAFAAKTPFEFSGLLSSTQRLLAMGFAAEEVMPALTSIGDAVGGLGAGTAGVERVTLALGQMMAKGKVSGEEMMQLTEIGIPAWEMLAETIGTDIPSAMEAVTKKQVSSSVAIEGLLSGMTKRFGGLMEQQSHTWGGLMSTIGDTWQQISGKLFLPLFNKILPGMEQFVQILGSPAFSSWVDMMGQGIGYVVDAVSPLIDAFGTQLFSAVAVFFNIIKELQGPFDAFIGTSQQFQNVVDRIGGPLATVVVSLMRMIDLMISGWDPVNAFQKTMHEMVNPKLANFLGDLAGLVQDVIFALGNLFSASQYPFQDASPLGQWLYEVTTNIREFISWAVKIIQPFLNWGDAAAALALMLGPKFLWGAISSVVGIIGSLITAFGPVIALFAAVTAAIALLRTAWETDFLGIRTSLLETWAVITNIFNSVVEAVSGIVEEFRNKWAILSAENASLGERLSLVWDTILETSRAVWAGIVEAAQKFLPIFIAKVTEWGTAAWEWIINVIPIAIEKLGQWFAAILTWFKQNMSGWIEQLQTWGSAIWQWIVDAIPVAIGKLGDWLRAIGIWIGAQLPNWIAMFLNWAAALYEWIGKAIPKAIDALTGFIRGLRERGETNGSAEFTSMVGGWALTLWRWIQNEVIPKIGPAFNRLIEAMLTYGREMLNSLVQLALELGRALWQWIADVTPIALRKLSEWGSLLWNWIKDQAPGWWDHLKTWGEMAWQWITKIAIPEAIKKIKEWAGMLWNWIKENAPIWWERLKIWAGMLWEWITKIAIPEAIKAIKQWATDFWGWIETNWPTWKENMIKAGRDAMQWLQDGIEIGWINLLRWFGQSNFITGFVVDMLQMFGVQLTPAYGIMEENGKQLAYSLNDGSRYGLDSLRQTGVDMGDAIDEGLRTSMDMHSPSRKMWGHGQDIIAGLKKGVMDGQVYVRQVLEDYSVVWENIVTKRWIPYFSLAGQSMARSIGDGLKSESQWVAEQIKAQMERTTNEINSYVAYFTRQAEIKAIETHKKIANSAKDAAKILKDLGIDTSKVVGYGPNGELILPGVTNLPKSSTPPPAPTTTAEPAVLPVKGVTIGEALGLDKVTTELSGQSIELLGGIKLIANDYEDAAKKANTAANNAKESFESFMSGVVDFLKGTLVGANEAFSDFKITQEKILRTQGSKALQRFLGSSEGQAFGTLKDVYGGIQNQIANILGVNPSELDVTSASGLRLFDRLKEVIRGTSVDTQKDFIGDLLQELVNFRTTANQGLGSEYFQNALPNDPRLTGQNQATNITVNLTTDANSATSLISTIQLMNSLYGTNQA